MSRWNGVGNWLKNNLDEMATVAGSVLVGGPAAGIAAVGKIMLDATGTGNPDDCLKTLESGDATEAVRIAIIKHKGEILKHQQEMLRIELDFKSDVFSEQQETIRGGDQSTDEYIRRTRPTMAKQSWTATIWYCVGCFGVHAITGKSLFDFVIAGVLSAPAWAYLGLRTGDKVAEAWKNRPSRR